MTDKVAELSSVLQGDDISRWVSNLWDTWDNQRSGIKASWSELSKYIFATDTSTTSNSSLPWKNSTTTPKICQIRDNLHSNYMSSLFPNDNWLNWEGYDQESSSRSKAEVIQYYMENKTRLSNYSDTTSSCIYDYIDYGNAFMVPVYESKSNLSKDGDLISSYTGPKSVRVSPLDIVFNPTAASFDETPVVIRSNKTLGEIKKMITYQSGTSDWEAVVTRREKLADLLSGISQRDWEKASQYAADGFGDYKEYLGSNNVEILEFWGDYHDPDSGELFLNKIITIADRAVVVRVDDIPTVDGRKNIRHVGWRKRQDNLWHMGPLENLVGLQYRIDHLENAKADALDLIIQPPLKIIGNVEEFVWGPNEEILIDEGGDVQEVSKSFSGVLTALNEIQTYEDKMELYAGAPREAMGVRTPGEKTAFEVQSLNNAAGRIFQEKVNSFEKNLMEPNLNDMLSLSIMNMSGVETIRIIDNDLKAQEFKKITKDDITGNGIIRPVGSRHFAQKAQELQNLVGVFSSPIADIIRPHTSGVNLTKFIEDVVNLKHYKIFRENVAVAENKDTQLLAAQSEEDNIMSMESEPIEGTQDEV